MPNFNYVAIDKNGKEIKGILDAPDKTAAIASIKGEGNLLLSVTDAGMLSRDVELGFLEKKPKPRDLAVFCRQFVSISSAGVPVISAFEMLAQQTDNAPLARAINSCCTSIRSGSSLTEAMQAHPLIFPDLFVTMVAAGEESGNLEVAFGRMGEQFEKDAKLQSMMKRAAIYPSVVLFVAIGVIMLMLGFVIPSFEELLTDLGSDLPLLTKVVLAAGRFISANWIVIIIVGAIGIFALIKYMKTESGRENFSGIALKMPLYGKLVTMSSSARMSRTLSTLIASGIPIIDGVEIVANTMTNVIFKYTLLSARDEVVMGTPLSEPLEASGYFPPLVCHMTKIGEEAGDLEGMLSKLADYYDEEVENATAAMMAAMEPAIIITLAAIIAVIVFAVILPLGDMYSALDSL